MRFVASLMLMASAQAAIPAAAENQVAPVKVLIVTGVADLPYHLWQETTASMRRILTASGRFDVRVVEEPRGLTSAAFEGYDVVVLNYNGPRWPPGAERGTEKFVREGGGLVAVHQASYGAFFGQEFRDSRWRTGEPGSGWPAFAKMIGASWAPEDIGHARRGVFEVEWIDPTHPVSSGLAASFVANDELYHKLNLSPGTQILAEAESLTELGGTGKREPVAWTNRFGNGRVFFTTLGHDVLAWHELGMANLFARGTEWAATGRVTLAPLVRGGAPGKETDVRLLVVTGGHSYPVSFYAMLNSLPGVNWTHAPNHAEAFNPAIENRFDVVLLHDMYDVTTEQTRARLRAFVEAGKGVVSVHHAIVDYTDWPWWYQEVTGGKYFVNPVEGHPASRFHEDVEYLVVPVHGKEGHPVLRGIGPLCVYDELYKGMYHSPQIEVLMETRHPDNDRPVVYVGPHPTARVVYVQLGHSDDTMKHPGFQRLIANSVAWAARRTN